MYGQKTGKQEQKVKESRCNSVSPEQCNEEMYRRKRSLRESVRRQDVAKRKVYDRSRGRRVVAKVRRGSNDRGCVDELKMYRRRILCDGV